MLWLGLVYREGVVVLLLHIVVEADHEHGAGGDDQNRGDDQAGGQDVGQAVRFVIQQEIPFDCEREEEQR